MPVVRVALVALSMLGAAAASAQPVGSIAPLRIVAPVADDDLARRSAVHCVAGRDFCLQAWREGDDSDDVWFLDLHQRVPSGADVAPVGRVAIPASEEPSRETNTIWPRLIREPSGALLFGVLRTRTTGFSGGGASETHLILFRQAAGAVEATEVLTARTGYGSMIRACFSEEDYRRRGACHDEYELDGTIALAPGAAGERPGLVLTTRARSFPRGARRDEERRRIPRADLIWEADPECSYRRTFAFNAASGHYEPDRPLPECSIYALP